MDFFWAQSLYSEYINPRKSVTADIARAMLSTMR
jgi:hypothetical protein